MDNKSQNDEVLTKEDKKEMASKDALEVAAKSAGKHFGGPLGGAAVNAALKTKTGQKVIGQASRMASSNPMVRNPLASSLVNSMSGSDDGTSDSLNDYSDNNDDKVTGSGDFNLSGLLNKRNLIIIGIIGGFISIVIFLVVLITPLMELGIIDISGIGNVSYNSVMGPVYTSSQNTYLWPVGGEEIDENGLATGEPYSTNVITNYDGTSNYGINIDSNGAASGVVNVIAVRPGEVIYPTTESQTQFEDNGSVDNTDGGGYGNYVKIKHSDGTYTLYAHLAKDSVTVMAGDVVSQGQVIGKMGNSGSSTETNLHFEIRNGSDTPEMSENPLEYIDPEDPRPKGYGNGDTFSITTTTLSKKEFISKMEDYCKRSGYTDFCNNFANNAGLVYDASIRSNVNPELVVVTAGTEQSWENACGNNNYWGINVTNTGGGCGTSYASLEAGIAGYGELLNSYTTDNAGSINSRYQERENAGCDPSGHGVAGTLVGMQSVYSWVGTYRYDPGGSSLGGCHVLNYVYGEGYCSTLPTCKDYNNCPANSATTVCEQNDYTAYQVKHKMDIRYDIFGL